MTLQRIAGVRGGADSFRKSCEVSQPQDGGPLQPPVDQRRIRGTNRTTTAHVRTHGIPSAQVASNCSDNLPFRTRARKPGNESDDGAPCLTVRTVLVLREGPPPRSTLPPAAIESPGRRWLCPSHPVHSEPAGALRRAKAAGDSIQTLFGWIVFDAWYEPWKWKGVPKRYAPLIISQRALPLTGEALRRGQWTRRASRE